ncbi:MAG: divalent-cation tolerance protein CutA [Candidatus Omnitrophica bacterium]|nr:divalent-cation tolerance protein CutA [Candidatus Omnitrophota bacterium]MDD5574090.1 divalent-cation tolerance protein CutA [Candidatus Omnitrophota bacterium]
MKYCVVLMTAPAGPEAGRLAEMLLRKKLCACVNIVPGLLSFFWWEGKIDRARETLLVAKTEQRLVRELVREVRKAHSYRVCEVVALPIIAGNPPYLEWITSSVGPVRSMRGEAKKGKDV